MKRICRLFLFFTIVVAQAAVSDDRILLDLIRNTGGSEIYPDADRVVVFDSTDVRVMDSGLSYVTIHQLVKILKPAGAITLSVQKIDYDPLSANVEIRLIRIFRKDGTIETMPPESVLDVPAPARMIYWGARQKIIRVGRMETGEALETVVFRKGFTYALLNPSGSNGFGISPVPDRGDDSRFIPPMRGHFYDVVPFWSEVPVVIKSYTISIPSDKPLQYQVYNGELASWIHFRGEQTRYHWEKKNTDPFKAEANMVDLSDAAPKLLVSTSPDWIAKSHWFHKVNEDYGSFQFTPEIKKKVDELTSRCESDEEKVSVLTHWAAEEIRYSGLSMGPGEGYTLHRGEMTFRDRCGVCKDKAGMLITLLRAAGYEAYPAMTMAGSRIDRIPADQFNHCVTIWKRGDKNYVLLDPTWVPGVRELWSSAEQQQEYLMGVPEGADLQTTPLSPPEKHYFRVRGKSTLAANGTLSGTVTVQAEGQSDARIRRGLVRNMKSLWQGYFDRAVYDLSPNARILSLDYVDPYDLSRPMRISIRYAIPEYAQFAGERLVFIPVVARHLFSDAATNSYLYMKTDLEHREYPFVTSCTKLIDFEETIEMPEGYAAKSLPEFESVAGEAADFSSSYSVDKNRLRFSETLSMKRRIYAAGEWPNFRKAVTALKTVSETPVVLVKQ